MEKKMMNLHTKINKTFKLFFLLALTGLVIPSCSKTSSQSCSQITIYDCITQKPSELYVKLNLSQNKDNSPVRVRFYIGNFDDGVLYDDFYTTNTVETYLVPTGQKYAASAQYLSGTDTILAIDGGKLNATSCKLENYDCYDWNQEMTLDLKLKKKK